MIKIIVFLMLFSLTFSLTSFSNDFQYDFLNLGANARVQALGNTGIVNAVDAEAVLYNPANIFSFPHKDFVFSLNPYYFDSSHLYFFHTMDSGQDPFTKIGFGFIRYSMDGIETRGVVRSDLPLGTVSATDQALIFATSQLISYSTSIGYSVGMIASNYKNTANDFIMNFGINHLAQDLRMKLNGTIQVYNDAGYKISMGGLYYNYPNIIPTVVLEIYSNNRFSATYLSFGLEYKYRKNLNLLFGYNKGQFSMGMGTSFIENADFYYAAVFTDLGVRHQYSFSMSI